MTPGQIATLQNLRPALRCQREVCIGERGQAHVDIPHQSALLEKGFVDLREGVFLSRAEAARRIGVAGIESLDSQTLFRLQKRKRLV